MSFQKSKKQDLCESSISSAFLWVVAGDRMCLAFSNSGSLPLAGSRCGSLRFQFEWEPEALAGIPSETLGTRNTKVQGGGAIAPPPYFVKDLTV
ncbi:MAG: hypothetical protein VKL39_14190 [Leptolyngbyaceae bacterium]|nr:hypothetical protein [Leptolyngbyaceae bacterium]